MSADKKLVNRLNELLDELNKTSSTRAEALLMTNFIESVLSDFMERMLHSEEARKIPRWAIINVLENRKIVEEDLAHDIRESFKIRDAYAHNVILTEANERAGKIIVNMRSVQKESPKVEGWDERPLDRKIIDVTDWILTMLVRAYYKFE